MKSICIAICGLLLYSLSAFAAMDKKGQSDPKKCPPWFPVSIENDVLYFDPLSASVSIQILNEQGEVVYEEYVNIDQPQSYCIPIGFLEPGDYKLVVSGENLNYTFEFYL